MTIYRHEKLTADPRSTVIPGTLKLSCAVSASGPGVVVDVTYSIEPTNRYWFDIEGTLAKRFTDRGVAVGGAPVTIARAVRIERRAEGTRPIFFYITASIIEDPESRIRTAAAVIPA